MPTLSCLVSLGWPVLGVPDWGSCSLPWLTSPGPARAWGARLGMVHPTVPQQPARRTVTPLHYHPSPGLTRPLGARPGKICPHIHEYQAGELHPLFHGLLPLGWPDPGVPYWGICPNFQGWPPQGGQVTKVPSQGSCAPLLWLASQALGCQAVEVMPTPKPLDYPGLATS